MLNDCEICWESPCICGWDFRNLNDDIFVGFLAGLIKYRGYNKTIAQFEEARQLHVDKQLKKKD